MIIYCIYWPPRHPTWCLCLLRPDQWTWWTLPTWRGFYLWVLNQSLLPLLRIWSLKGPNLSGLCKGGGVGGSWRDTRMNLSLHSSGRQLTPFFKCWICCSLPTSSMSSSLGFCCYSAWHCMPFKHWGDVFLCISPQVQQCGHAAYTWIDIQALSQHHLLPHLLLHLVAWRWLFETHHDDSPNQ